jgi:hypothetical protein
MAIIAQAAAYIAVYANPRGRATGTFIIDGVLLQAHALPPFGHYKLREYTIPPAASFAPRSSRCPKAARPISYASFRHRRR